ncbi:hypothetical protein D3C75_1086900 [compost metagenome]
MGALVGKYRAFTCVEQRALFQQPDCLRYRVQCAAACGQNSLPGSHNVGKRPDIILFFLCTQCRTGNCARTTMNGNHWFAH